MANKFTKSEYDSVKNSTYDVIRFSKEGKRMCSITGCSVDRMIKEVTKNGRFTVMVFNDGELKGNEDLNGDIEFYINRKIDLLTA